MKVRLPEKKKCRKRDKTIYIAAVAISLIALIVIIYIDIINKAGGIENFTVDRAEEQALGKKSDDAKTTLKSYLDNKFSNSLEQKDLNVDVKKINEAEDIVYSQTPITETKENSYTVNAVLPFINIDSDIIKTYNKEIEDVFKNKITEYVSGGNYVVYQTDYVASINKNDLSIMIRATLKEGSNAQRSIIYTYNYDIENNKELSLEDVIEKKGLNKNDIQQEIKNTIKEENEKSEGIGKVGYNTFYRDLNDSMYLVENSRQFYCTSNTIYIIYAYGNNKYTNTVDVVII